MSVFYVPGILLGILHLFLFNHSFDKHFFSMPYICFLKKTVSCKIVYISEKLSSIETFHKFHSLFLLLLTSYTSVIHLLQIKVFLKLLKILKSFVIISTDEKPRLREIASQNMWPTILSPISYRNRSFNAQITSRGHI